MTDISLTIIDNCFDIVTDDTDLLSDDGLETAVAISLFTDARVNDEQLPYLETNKRGWWGDLFSIEDQDKIGSRIWTLDRSKVTNETLNRMNEFCLESLEWMKEDGIADEIGIDSIYNEEKHLITSISINRPDGLTERFSVLWDKQELRRR